MSSSGSAASRPSSRRPPGLRHQPQPEEAVVSGEFRADLYYRINVVPSRSSCLRERRPDIPAFAEHFSAFNAENDRTLEFSDQAVNVFTSRDFPGNVRDFENCVSPGGDLVPRRPVIPT
ncbi:MAG: hypothetical protein IPM60_18005 [Rhodospirillales bacterium]|nr:hypothetical protein [Rhodospirillales bacterium]